MARIRLFSVLLAQLVVASAALAAGPAVWEFKKELWPELIQSVPAILESQDRATGRFGSGIWIVNDQERVFALAVAWALEHPGNPFHHRDDVLAAIMAGGDALIDDQDATGQWEFRKKDGSTWGKTYMPWTYSRWVRAFGLIREAMPAERRTRWEKALTLGYEGIAKKALNRIHNIPTHHAMGLYRAGQIFERPDWRDQARDFLAKVCEAQNPGGYWSENSGPVVGYNFVYTEALGAYYAMSGDASVLPAVNRAVRFHAGFTYPDGSRVETIDERNPYEEDVSPGTVGFTLSPEGRRFLHHQWQRRRGLGHSLGADAAAAFLLHGQEGPLAPEADQQTFVLGANEAVVQWRRPWFACLSAFHCPVTENRWIQDRQNLVSVFHAETGLIVGGGNTKLQPRWSTFVVGDPKGLAHRAGDTQPKFAPPADLWHVPTQTALDPESLALRLNYGDEPCQVRVDLSEVRTVRLVYEAGGAASRPVTAHVPLLPHLGEAWETAAGRRGTLGEEPFQLSPGEAGGWFAHHGWRISLPPTATIMWPALPHNPYRKDGRASAREGRIVAVLPFSHDVPRYELKIDLQEKAPPAYPKTGS